MVLRKLALKSIFNFGRFYDYTVSQALSLNKHRYLIWVYYNCSHISFLDEILDILDITEERRIEKPGKDVFYHEEHKNEFMPIHDKMQTKLVYKTKKHFHKKRIVDEVIRHKSQNSRNMNKEKNLLRHHYNE